jgi:cytochrome P450
VESYLDYVDADPYDYYRRKLEAGPIHWDEGMRAWLVFGYDECRFVSTRPELFGHPYSSFKGAKEVQGGTRGILMLQGEEHDRMHNFLLSHFTPAVVRKYRETLIRPLAKFRLDALAASTRVDLAEDFAAKLPSDVIAALLGLDWHDEKLLAKCRDWNHSIFRWSETFGEDEDVLRESLVAAAELEKVLMPVIRARKSDRRDDLISVLWEKGPEIISPWGEAEVLAQCRVLFFAGSDTTAHFLRNAFYVLTTQPHLQKELRGNEKKIADFIEEVLRYYSPVHFRVRVALQDTEVAGQTIRNGDRLHPMNAAANRDPRHYQKPNEIDIARKPLRDHLAFHVGQRFCIGAALAKGEGLEAIHELLQRFEHIARDEEAEPPRFIGHMPRSHRPINVVMIAREPQTADRVGPRV